jgi:tetratricopeptide (TPR) repeat protein
MLRGDLDWIAMKALEKDRERRYQTARGFALDIEHYLQDEPVQARPPSRLYRLHKLVRRNKATFAALSATVLALIVGLTVSTWLFVRASNAERQQTRLRMMAEEREKVARAAILLNQKKPDEADALLGDKNFQLSQPSLEATQVFRDLATWSATQHRDWHKAATRLLALIQVNRFDENDQSDNATRDLLLVAPTLIEAGDIETYEKIRLLAISRFGRSQNPVAAEQILKISMLLPADKTLLTAVEPLAEVAENSLRGQNVPRGYLESWRSMVLGLLEYRRGNYEKAWEWSQRSLDSPIRTASRDAAARLVQAMAAWQMNRKVEARALLQQVGWMVEAKIRPPLIVVDRDHGFWFDWVDAHILLREATDLIQKPGTSLWQGS